MSKGQAAVLKSTSAAAAVAHGETTSGEPIKGAAQIPNTPGAAEANTDAGTAATTRPSGEPPMDPYVPGQQPVVLREPGIVPGDTAPPNLQLTATHLTLVLSLLDKLTDRLMPEGQMPDMHSDTNALRTSPGVRRTVQPSVGGMSSVTPQMEPGKLPKMKLNGMVLSIENPRGSIRKGMDTNGNKWASKMVHPYGFIKGTKGADGDDVDCFIGNSLQSSKVFVVNQNDPTTGEFDEHKVMFGFDSEADAKNAYDQSYNSPGWTPWTGFDSMYETGIEDFKTWVYNGVKDQPFSNPLNAVNIAQAGSAPETA
jgi:hypothetical protein